MKITIKSTNLDLTPAIREYINEKIGALAKFVARYEENGSELLARVEIARTTNHHHKGDVYYAEVNIDNGKNIARAEVEDAEIHAAIDKTQDILKRQLVKLKEK